jgi:hypothetical protein
MVRYEYPVSIKCEIIEDIYFLNPQHYLVGAVGLISIHLAFYQMNPWPTANAALSIFGTYTSSTPVGVFCFFATDFNVHPPTVFDTDLTYLVD